MGRSCEICSKGLQNGHNVSHSNRKTKRVFRPNVQKIRVVRDGRVMRMRVCTRCIRSGLVQKPA
jgi:large subunit ribosomal protein L28